jgi:hypothetical protein
MNTAEQILVIVLAAVLALFLVIAIMILVQVLRLIKVLRTLAEKAEHLVDNAESAAALLKSTVGKFTVLRFAHSIFDMVTKHKSKD